MEATDMPQFTAAMASLSEAFESGKQMTAARMEIYFRVLRDVPLEAVILATSKALQRCTYMPRPGELLRFARGSNAALAFETLAKARRVHGAFESVTFDDGAITQIVKESGGWPRVCDMSGDQFSIWFRKEFIERYEQLRYVTNMSETLRGLSQQDKAPVRIGCDYLVPQRAIGYEETKRLAGPDGSAIGRPD